jgi:hypothetical protein
MDGHTVLNRPLPTDLFRESVARAIETQSREYHESNGDAWGADRSLRACENLADSLSRYLSESILVGDRLGRTVG